MILLYVIYDSHGITFNRNPKSAKASKTILIEKRRIRVQERIQASCRHFYIQRLMSYHPEPWRGIVCLTSDQGTKGYGIQVLNETVIWSNVYVNWAIHDLKQFG